MLIYCPLNLNVMVAKQTHSLCFHEAFICVLARWITYVYNTGDLYGVCISPTTFSYNICYPETIFHSLGDL